ncbi:MAG: glutathione S-transferase family protein [Pseudomonadales bacterium]|jgi:glutathione S-transferase
MQLVIGNKNYSSWSLRPWLLLHANGIRFSEVSESLTLHQIKDRLGKYSETCRVPVLIDGELNVHDSLAICEYLNEAHLNGKGWPTDLAQRAQARAIVAEMHSGFNALRGEMPMNCRLSKPLNISNDAKADMVRIESIFNQFAKPNGDGQLRLFGEFGIADCFFMPIASRLNSYGFILAGTAGEYVASMLNHPSYQAWLVDALTETEVVPEDEV